MICINQPLKVVTQQNRSAPLHCYKAHKSSVLFKNGPVQQLLHRFGQSGGKNPSFRGLNSLLPVMQHGLIKPKFKIQVYNTFVKAKRQKKH